MTQQHNTCIECKWKSRYYRSLCEQPNHMKVNKITGHKKGVDCYDVRYDYPICAYFEPIENKMKIITAEEAKKIREEAIRDRDRKSEAGEKSMKSLQREHATEEVRKFLKNFDISEAITNAAVNNKYEVRLLLNSNHGELDSKERYLGPRDFETLPAYIELRDMIQAAGYEVMVECRTSLAYGNGSDSIPKCDGVWNHLVIKLK